MDCLLATGRIRPDQVWVRFSPIYAVWHNILTYHNKDVIYQWIGWVFFTSEINTEPPLNDRPFSSAFYITIIRTFLSYYLICLKYYENASTHKELVSLFSAMFHVCITETQVNMWSLEHSSLNQPNLRIRLISTWKMHGGFSGVLLTPVWNSKKENIWLWKIPTRWAHCVLFFTKVFSTVYMYKWRNFIA